MVRKCWLIGVGKGGPSPPSEPCVRSSSTRLSSRCFFLGIDALECKILAGTGEAELNVNCIGTDILYPTFPVAFPYPGFAN
jgi:hypothetical protein